MKNHIKLIAGMAIIAGGLILPSSCTKNYADPNKALQDPALSSPRGLAGIVTGLQRIHTLGRASNMYNHVTVNGLTTNELFVVNTGNTGEVQLQTGGNTVDGSNSILTTYWTNLNKIIYDADLVMENAKKLGDKNYASGLIAYASIFKALSIGQLAEFWEKIPAGIGTNVAFIDRIDGYKKAITVLDEAAAAMAANPISAAFLSNVPVGIDISNTLSALKARYSNAAGLYAQALTAANAVDLTKKSTFNFDALSLNPLYEIATATNNVVQVKDSTLGLLPGLQPDPGDKRVPFYTSINTTIAPRFRINGFGGAAQAAFPVYLPGEMTLIKAEAYIRQASIPNGIVEINKIRTKKPADDPFGVGADLGVYTGSITEAALLEEIYKQRSIELYMSGLKLEDMRRFGRPNAERKRNLMPYPSRERDNNTNTPADPAF